VVSLLKTIKPKAKHTFYKTDKRQIRIWSTLDDSKDPNPS